MIESSAFGKDRKVEEISLAFFFFFSNNIGHGAAKPPAFVWWLHAG